MIVLILSISSKHTCRAPNYTYRKTCKEPRNKFSSFIAIRTKMFKKNKSYKNIKSKKLKIFINHAIVLKIKCQENTFINMYLVKIRSPYNYPFLNHNKKTYYMS